jgi:BirA family biotin operon repressor/biotin-[acetyl-CoA-carboxylase] ligase
MPESLAPAAVLPQLAGRFGRPYIYAERCPSTQRLLPRTAPEGAVAVAEEQTEGRGRLGRRWLAPPRTSILCSVLLRPPLPTARWPELSLLAGGACAEAIADVTGLAPTIKEPNDVLVHGRKAAGILAEASEGRVVLGVGINVNITESEFADELRASATSLVVELGRPVSRVTLLAALLERLERRYDAWVARS